MSEKENGRREEEGMDKRRICKRRIISGVCRIFQPTRKDGRKIPKLGGRKVRQDYNMSLFLSSLSLSERKFFLAANPHISVLSRSSMFCLNHTQILSVFLILCSFLFLSLHDESSIILSYPHLFITKLRANNRTGSRLGM